MFIFPKDTEPKHHWTRAFTINTIDCLPNMTLSTAALCNYLQEIAGQHANKIGIGLNNLISQGFTWVLTRLNFKIYKIPHWEDEIFITTWPCGNNKKLIALRHFVVTNAANEILVEACSEWLYIDLKSMRPNRLPENIIELATPTTYQLNLGEDSKLIIPNDWQITNSAIYPVRKHDIDANNHVNNIHYTEWAFEAMTNEWFNRQPPCFFDIVYKHSAKLGNTIKTECGALPNSTIFYHRISDANTGVEYAIARSVFSNK